MQNFVLFRDVMLDNMTNQNGAATFIGLGEVKFYLSQAEGPVAEPAPLALVLLALAGMARRRG